MDEPTVGLDPISRTNLWNGVLKHAKQDRTVILTSTHSLSLSLSLSLCLDLYLSNFTAQNFSANSAEEAEFL